MKQKDNSTVVDTWVFVRNTVCILSLILVIMSPFQSKENNRTAELNKESNKNIYFLDDGGKQIITPRDGTIVQKLK